MFLKLKFYIIRLTFFLTIVSIGLMLTGSISRDYDVLKIEDSATIGDEDFSVSELALKYLPQVVTSDDIDGASLDQIHYEVIDNKTDYTINYYYQWSAENQPSFLPNLLTNTWRFVYFRFALEDVEFVQLSVDKNTGLILETKVKNGTQPHNKKGACFVVESWNHEFAFCDSNESKPALPKAAPLVYFKNSQYVYLKMARRSQGDFKTDDNIMNFPFIIFLASLATYYFRHLQKDYNNEYSGE